MSPLSRGHKVPFRPPGPDIPARGIRSIRDPPTPLRSAGICCTSARAPNETMLTIWRGRLRRPDDSERMTQHVLFIGNSFTARNDVPGLLASLAKARGKRLEHRLISAGGASLRMHWNRGEARKEIERRRYDWVVLQEQSTLPIKNAARMHENIRLFHAAIAASGARTALYLTWARAKVPETQATITDAYTSVGEELGATIVPVGVAWKDVLGRPDHPVLHDKDGSHPTLAGSYLAACVFLVSLLGENPDGIESEVKGLSRAEVKLLQQVAWKTATGAAA